MRWDLRAAVRRLYVVVLAVVLVVALYRGRADLATLVDGTRPWPLLAALALTFGQLGLSAVFWATALAAFGSGAALSSVVSAAARSLPARYVPGSLWYPLGRAALLHAHGASRAALGLVAVVEHVMSVVVAFALGGVLLATAGRLPGGTAQAAVAGVVLLAALSPPALNRVLAVAARRRGGPTVTVGWRAYGGLILQMAAFWLLSAAAFVLYLRAFPQLQPGGSAAVAGAFLVAWGIGFLAVFAPQGLGVFEVTLAALLTGRASAGLAVVIAGFRALIAVRDVLAFALDAVWRATRPGARAGSGPTG